MRWTSRTCRLPAMIPAQDGSGGVVCRLLLGYGQIYAQGYVQAGRRVVLILQPGSLDPGSPGRYELALVLLGHPGAAPLPALFLDEGRIDPGALLPGYLDLLPAAALGPGLVEESLLAPGSRHEDEPASGDGKHRPDCAIELVWDSGRFIQYQEGDCADAPDGLLRARQGQDPGAVGKADGELGVAVELDVPVHQSQELGELEHEFLGLPERRRVQDYGAAGPVDGLPEGQDGRDGGLAGLPGAVQDDPLGPGAEELGLPGIGLELEVIERKKDGISLGPVKDPLLRLLGSFQLYRV